MKGLGKCDAAVCLADHSRRRISFRFATRGRRYLQLLSTGTLFTPLHCSLTVNIALCCLAATVLYTDWWDASHSILSGGPEVIGHLFLSANQLGPSCDLHLKLLPFFYRELPDPTEPPAVGRHPNSWTATTPECHGQAWYRTRSERNELHAQSGSVVLFAYTSIITCTIESVTPMQLHSNQICNAQTFTSWQ